MARGKSLDPWTFVPNKSDNRAMTGAAAGTYWGRGIRNPIGKIREGTGVNPMPKKKLGTPPKSLA